ncbi:hypothetical protein GCM10023093_07180 [Nemorincola caseinilytica]|uniref:NACHT domain-containing protein n=1 Tax=Nemorincola caseinilytica TaxID=2054315 RepID=A0ABP8N8P5_9BACT
MNARNIPWHVIDCKKFENLIRWIAKTETPKINWDLYLKSGNKQHGIDIKGFDYDTGKDICIQCKFTPELSLANLKDLLREFEEGTLRATTRKFILATTSDLQKRTVKEYFDAQVGLFKDKYQIELESWDIENIEVRLKKCYGLVHKYFGKGAADNHCFLSNKNPVIVYNPVQNFIERSVLKVNEPNADNEHRFYFGERTILELKSLFYSDDLLTQKICLIADAYQGKSTLLEHLAYELQESSLYVPVILKIKSLNVRSIESIIEESYSYIKQFPGGELVLIFDGLDEVTQNKFNDYKNMIIEYSNANPAVNIIFSCRKLFYSHYRLSELKKDFDFYELMPIADPDINTFTSTLGNKKKNFTNYIAKCNLGSLLYHPFYLVNLVRLFQKERGISSIPKTRKEIVYYLVEESFKPSDSRPLVHGNELLHEKVEYTACIKNLH